MRHYIQDALRTDGTWEQYADITFGNLNLQTMRLLHAAMGLCTEAIELEQAFHNSDAANVCEEIGDTAWYIALGWNACECKWGEFPIPEDRLIAMPVYEYIKHLRIESAELLDKLKKHLFYGKPFGQQYMDKPNIPREEFFQHLNMCKFFLVNIAANIGGEGHYEACLEINIRKLKKRYPDKFTGYNAINRDIIAEREVIENG